jgi:predicted PurR-regulated permease PerM
MTSVKCIEVNPINNFWKNKGLWILIYSLLGLSVIYLLILTKPFIFGVFEFLKTVLMPFLIALMISYLLNPIVHLLHLRKVPRTFAVLLIYSVFTLTVIIMAMNLTPIFAKQWNELIEHIPDLSNKVQVYMVKMNEHQWLPESIRQGIEQSLRKLEYWTAQSVSKAMNRIGSTLNVIFIAGIIPFLVFYMLKDFQLLEKTALAIVPRPHRKQTVKILIDIDTALGHYIRGQLIVCLIVGMLAYLGYWWFKMPYPLLLASLVAVFNVIPYLGPFFGATPAILMAATISWKMVLFVVLLNLFIQIVESNFISPQVVGKKLHLHPLVIMLSLLVGGELAGIGGLILAVPVFVVIKVIGQHIFNNYMHHLK